jgi:hypothetical protein
MRMTINFFNNKFHLFIDQINHIIFPYRFFLLLHQYCLCCYHRQLNLIKDVIKIDTSYGLNYERHATSAVKDTRDCEKMISSASFPKTDCKHRDFCNLWWFGQLKQDKLVNSFLKLLRWDFVVSLKDKYLHLVALTSNLTFMLYLSWKYFLTTESTHNILLEIV